MQQPSFLMGPPCLIFRSAMSMLSSVLLVCVQLASLAVNLLSRHHCMCCAKDVHRVWLQCPTAHKARYTPETLYKACYAPQSVTDYCNKASGLIPLGHQLPSSQTQDVTRAAELRVILCQLTSSHRQQGGTGIAQHSVPCSIDILVVVSPLQMQAIDVQAMAMCLAACWVPPLKQLNRHKPSPRVCTSVGLMLLICMASSLQAAHVANAVFLCTRPWFNGGNGTSDMVNLHVCLLVVCTGLCGLGLGYISSQTLACARECERTHAHAWGKHAAQQRCNVTSQLRETIVSCSLRVMQCSSARKPCQLSTTAILCCTTLNPQCGRSSNVLLYIFCLICLQTMHL